MKNKFLKFLLLALIFVYNFALCGPPNPGGGGGDSDADQVPDTPVNMFVVPLALLAVSFIIFFVRKQNSKTVKNI